MNAYIQDEVKGKLNKEIAKIGLEDRGYIVKVLKDKDPYFLAEDDIFYGNVNWIKQKLDDMQYSQNPIGNVPFELLKYAGRNIVTVTLKEALHLWTTTRKIIFIKPVPTAQKSFTGLVLAPGVDLTVLANYPDDGLVLMSESLSIRSEWRCFILDGEIIDAEHYKGDFEVSPDFYSVRDMVHAWTASPIAYALDVGILGGVKNPIIIECNDVMSLGWYGLIPYKAGVMLEARWQQIHKNKGT